MLFDQIVSDLVLCISSEHKRGALMYEQTLIALPGKGGKVHL